MKNCIPSHLFVNMWLQKLSRCYVSLSDWLTTIFVNPWKNQKYLFIINLFTSLLQMKLFSRNDIAFVRKCTVEESISCTIFFLRLCDCVQKQPFGGSPESTCYYMMRKAFKNSSREVHCLVRAQFTGLERWYKWTCSLVFFNDFNYFRKLFIVALRFLKQLFTGNPRMAASICYF